MSWLGSLLQLTAPVADLNHFASLGRTMPVSDPQVAADLADQAAVLKVSTVTRRATGYFRSLMARVICPT